MDNGIPIEYVGLIFRSDKYNFQNMRLNLESNIDRLRNNISKYEK